jgi:hypothetical protein
MYKPSTYLVVTLFSYLSTYLYMRPISYRNDYQGETKYKLTWGSSTTE